MFLVLIKVGAYTCVASVRCGYKLTPAVRSRIGGCTLCTYTSILQRLPVCDYGGF